MKNAIKMCCIFFWGIGLGYSQEETKSDEFYLGSDKVKVYNYESDTKGFILVDVFKDNYNIKLTNKLYKIRLSYPEYKKIRVQQLTANLLDGNNAADGFQSMVWKKNRGSKKPMYEIRLEDGKLYMRINRKQMDEEGYRLLTKLGQAFIKEMNS